GAHEGRPHEVPAAAVYGSWEEPAHEGPRRRDLRLRAGGISLPVPPRDRDRHGEVRGVRRPAIRRFATCGAALLWLLCPAVHAGAQGGAAVALALTSPAFGPNGSIPAKHTCEGGDVSPALAWSGVPSGAKSLVVIVDDPDAPDPKAPERTWVHWVLYN